MNRQTWYSLDWLLFKVGHPCKLPDWQQISPGHCTHTAGWGWSKTVSQSQSRLLLEKINVATVVEQVPLSRNACTRRIADIARQLEKTVLGTSQRCEAFSIALDETSDTAQIGICVRYFLDGQFCEDFATAISLEGRTTGITCSRASEIHVRTRPACEKNYRCGTPAMVGRRSGFLKCLREPNPDVIALHCTCTIHE